MFEKNTQSVMIDAVSEIIREERILWLKQEQHLEDFRFLH